MSATSRAMRPIATAGLQAAPSMKVPAKPSLGPVMLALMLATPTASAEERGRGEVARLAEHPAVVVARRGAQVDPTSKFYLHPARLSWTLQRPISQGKDSPVAVGSSEGHSAIDDAVSAAHEMPDSKFSLPPHTSDAN